MLMHKGLVSKDEMLDLLLDCHEVVVVDIETTGFSPNKGAEIIEIGAFRYNFDTGKHKKFHLYVKPRVKHIPKKIVELTRVTDEMVANAPYEEIALKSFHDFIGNSLLAFHNASFDWIRFLSPGLAKIGCVPQNPVICTKILSQWLLPMLGYTGQYKLCDLCLYFGCEMKGAHRADVDAMYTTSLTRKLREIGEGLNIQSTLFDMKEEVPAETRSFDGATVYRVNYWKKGKEERLYISTSVADIYYDYTRNIWSIQRLRSKVDLDMNTWEPFLVRNCGIVDMVDWLEEHRTSA